MKGREQVAVTMIYVAVRHHPWAFSVEDVYERVRGALPGANLHDLHDSGLR